ncbi:MAG: DUF962 domain-containing protein [Hyphomicrobium sp.]|jgi:hypothetical protein|uniref:DUF962 domain-containing protein n=1 Tax=Hyphomicrobium sp. TaxID=82 RepID=UPI0025B7AC50|nr:DUF962 domain-containing protein [Hyphomicrobium sp.]MBX9861878.1 DUF962 domain-containing protein [Hyphomicrobium sp.]
MTAPASFEEFWPQYLEAHSSGKTRWLHVFGTLLGFGIAAVCLGFGRPLWALSAVGIAYGIAWISHLVFEKNMPATFSNPWWSLRGDMRMVQLALTGGLKSEIARFQANKSA